MAKRPRAHADAAAIAAALRELATLLELLGENPFKVRAHENAAAAIEGGEFDPVEEALAGTLGERRGFGESMVKKVRELVTTGHMAELEDLRRQVPPGLIEMLRIPGFGPKKIQAVWRQLDITTVDALAEACAAQRLRGLPGFGAKTEEKILEGIAQVRTHAGQVLWAEAWARAAPLADALRRVKAVQRLEVAGSLRRRREVVKDIDIVASSDEPLRVMAAFKKLPGVAEVTASGETKTSVRLEGGLACDLRVVTDAQFPFALAHFTGSKDHNVAMRGRAQQRFGIRMSEYGLFDEGHGGKLLACRDEAAIHRRLGLAFIEPELRENAGEIEAAEEGTLPDLVRREDLRGTLHVHTTHSDGKASVAAMAEAAARLGFEWLGLADHSVSAAYAGGMKPGDVRRQFEEIDAINARGGPCRLFKGIEVDILADGDIDYDEAIWRETDFLVASVHSGFKMTEREMTRRLCRALEHPYVTILGHPTGRLLLRRAGYPVDLEAVIATAAKRRKMIEINCDPNRMDLDWRWLRRARDAGVTLPICPDAHDPAGLEHTWLGVGIARKGWLRARDVLNCLSADQVAKAFAATRA